MRTPDDVKVCESCGSRWPDAPQCLRCGNRAWTMVDADTHLLTMPSPSDVMIQDPRSSASSMLPPRNRASRRRDQARARRFRKPKLIWCDNCQTRHMSDRP